MLIGWLLKYEYFVNLRIIHQNFSKSDLIYCNIMYLAHFILYTSCDEKIMLPFTGVSC